MFCIYLLTQKHSQGTCGVMFGEKREDETRDQVSRG